MARKATVDNNPLAEAAAALKALGLDVIKIGKKPRVVLPFGIPHLDHEILGTGGLVAGKITQIWGPKSSGKTTMVYRLIAQAQKLFPHKFVVLFDSEFAFEEDRAADAGVDLSSLQLITGNLSAEVYPKILQYTQSGACSLAVLDSLGNVNTQKDQPGVFAKQTTQFSKDFCRAVYEHSVVPLLVNHVTKKIGAYGDPDDYPGGENLKHNLQMSLKVRRVEFVKDSSTGDPTGIRIGVRVDKNKMAPERATDQTNHPVFYFKDGLERSKYESTIDDALRRGFIQAGGAGRFKIVDADGQEIAKFHGREKMKTEIMSDAQLFDRLSELTYGSGGNLPPQTIDDSEGMEVSD